MKQPQSKSAAALDEAACVYGAGVLLKHVQALAEEVQGVRAGSEDIEFIHRSRVASRRLRAALPLFRTCLPDKKSRTWLKQLRSVTRALGDARDTDVQIERLEKFFGKLPEKIYQPGVSRLMLRLGQKRAWLQPSVVKAMEELLESQVLDEMSAVLERQASRANEVYVYTPALYQHSFHNIHSRLEDLLAYEEIVEQPDKVEELHEMRIAAKWLRYTLETFAPLYASQLKPHLQTVRKAQDLLGDIHDSDVWGQLLPNFLEEERQRTLDYFGHERPYKRLVAGIQFYQQNLAQTRAELYEEFVCDWQEWKAQEIWTSLKRTIQVPFLQPESIYPPTRGVPDGSQDTAIGGKSP